MKALTKNERYIIRLMVFVGILSILNFAFWFFKLGYKPSLLFWLLSISICYGLMRILYMWYHYIAIKIPKAPVGHKKFTVDILTTYFPGEPYEMILETLKAIQKITYPHTTYLCDEANDDYLKEVCQNLNVIHVTRSNRINAKAGNINNALKQASGEICVILDPDHIPKPYFLDPILPYFNDCKVGFVQIVQSYYNSKKSLVARGAAEQTFQFYGPMMMSMNRYGTVNAIGANCTFRRAALDSIGGHAPGLSEDMHTAMLLYSKGWKSVYVPEVLAKGLVPEDLSTYFKQQLKWSRGTFDLLFYVYPKLIKSFTTLQKIHFALLPLHYLVGLIYLINFSIPILALLSHQSPWNGDLIHFMAIGLPVSLSVFLIRAYIQKWVIEEKERGFHIIGGLLQMNTWWIFLLGFVYTLFRKKIPYLPTPKTGANRTPIKLILPNLFIAFLSLFAIFYGLSKDLTPFSLFMAFFAFINALIMFFSLYLGANVTNANKILRTNLKNNTITFLVKLKHGFEHLTDKIFVITRKIAAPVLVVGSILFFWMNSRSQNIKMEHYIHEKVPLSKSTYKYLGIFHPSKDDGISDMTAIKNIEHNYDSKFAIISIYHAWGDSSVVPFPKRTIDSIFTKGSLPMITWEPWTNTFPSLDSIETYSSGNGVFPNILDGIFDDYIDEYAALLKSYEKPIFLRFAHEFDNPSYPWSINGTLLPGTFKKAWQYVFERFEKNDVQNVIWVWNPWKYSVIEEFYPGDHYVDWIGLTLLNYGDLNEDGKWKSFKDIYNPFREEILKLNHKPVMLAEFGSLTLGGDSKIWVNNALIDVQNEFEEIKSIVLFDSQWDKNIPANKNTDINYLKWAVGDISKLNSAFPSQWSTTIRSFKKKDNQNSYLTQKLRLRASLGVNYKKGNNWTSNNFSASKVVLEQDFKLMKQLGFNLVKYTGPTIYDYNVLKAINEDTLNVLYSFWIPEFLDFTKDSKSLQNIENEIIKTIKERKKEQKIIGWHIGNDVSNALQKYYDKPFLIEQQDAFLVWLKKLTTQIKNIDKERPLLLDITVDGNTISLIEKMRALNIDIDQLSLIITEIEAYDATFEYLKSNEISYVIGDVSTAHVKTFIDTKEESSIIIRNWQDEWHSSKLTLDGLIDFEGRKKNTFLYLSQKQSNPKAALVLDSVKILLPTKIVKPNAIVNYNALFYTKNGWLTASSFPNRKLEWHLLKTDGYKNIIVKKHVGNKAILEIKIPEDYDEKNYELLLVYHQDDTVSTFRSPLNTPLHPLLLKNTVKK